MPLSVLNGYINIGLPLPCSHMQPTFSSLSARKASLERSRRLAAARTERTDSIGLQSVRTGQTVEASKFPRILTSATVTILARSHCIVLGGNGETDGFAAELKLSIQRSTMVEMLFLSNVVGYLLVLVPT